MPNIKSAKKRVLVNDKKTEQNKNIRSEVKTAMKKVDLLIKEGKLEDAKVALSAAFASIDAACSKNIYHKNNASNKKAKLAKKVSAAFATATIEEAPAVVEETPVVVEEAPVAEPVKKPRKPRAKKVEAPAE
ncbi:MAG: 30S ribosomal protein S20 [Clostridiales bacterium]|nr:30S ribosomal protein S20 [Clostridiales bacterium]